MEMAASRILTYQAQQVPDLLQTPEYARAIADADPDTANALQSRIAGSALIRQQMILEERQPELAVIIGEGALRQMVGGAHVMNAQLAKLADTAKRPGHHHPGTPVHLRGLRRQQHRAVHSPSVRGGTGPRHRPPARPRWRDLPREPGRGHPLPEGIHAGTGIRAHPRRVGRAAKADGEGLTQGPCGPHDGSDGAAGTRRPTGTAGITCRNWQV